MPEFLITLILGIIQGVTEFLPISSDGHLEIAKYFLGDKSKGMESLELTVLLHIATTFSICYVLRNSIAQLFLKLFKGDPSSWNLAMLIAISMIPAGIVGLFFEKEVSTLFGNGITLVAIMLLLNGILLWFGNQSNVTNEAITGWKAFALGIAQMFAILPGISRSGSTISVAAMMKINRSEAAEFSFLMVLPLIFGKIGKDILEGSLNHFQYSTPALSVGFIAAFIVGVFSFRLLLRLVRDLKLQYFAYYCLIIGAALLVYVAIN